MKVIFDNIIFELQKAGGISKYWSKLIEYFIKNEKIDLINIQNKNATKNVFYPKELSLNIIEESNLLPLKIRRYKKINIPDYGEIFHSSYYRIPYIKNKSLKQVVTVHDFMYEYFDKGLKKTIHTWQKKRAINNADAIICVSSNTKKDLLKFFPDIQPDKVYVVPNGVDEEFKILERIPNIYVFRNVILKKQKFMLYVGNRNGCKNFSFVVNLYKKSKTIKKNNMKIVCVGGGEFTKKEIDSFKKLNCNIDDFLNFQNVTNEELNILYNIAYALIFPSKYEGFGIPALEAQAAGCPVVFAKTSSLPEIMGYDDLGFELNNIEESEEKLKRLENNDVREKIIEKGIKHASKLTWKNTADLTFEVYKKILGV